MNDFVYVEFIVDAIDAAKLIEKLCDLGNDFIVASYPVGFTNLLEAKRCYITSGKINAECASMIKLRDPFLSDHMRISYISDELKDKYRSR
jgi:hypothetical protein